MRVVSVRSGPKKTKYVVYGSQPQTALPAMQNGTKEPGPSATIYVNNINEKVKKEGEAAALGEGLVWSCASLS